MTPRSIPIALALTLAAPHLARANTGVDCYTAGNAALDRRDPAAAAHAFEASLALPMCQPSAAGLLYNLGAARRQLAEQSGDHTHACRAAEAFTQALARGAEGRVAEAARSEKQMADATCTAGLLAAEASTPPPPTKTPIGPYLLLGSAGISAITAAVLGGLVRAEIETAAERERRSEWQSHVDTGRDLATGANIAWAVAGAAVTGAVVWWWLGDSPRGPD